MYETEWHIKPIRNIAQYFDVDIAQGLLDEQVLIAQKKIGKNIFIKGKKKSIFKKVIEQFENPLAFILFIAGAVTIVLGEHIDAFVIFIALIINVAIGLFQEIRAGNAFEKLSSSQEQHATVIREGKKRIIDARELVPGDIVELSAGNAVPGDIRLIEEQELQINEAPLTGESLAVEKNVKELRGEVAISEQHNMAWMGTFVVSGAGKGVVVGTGSNTQIGKIATFLGEEEEAQTPIQKNIRHLAIFLSVIIGVIVLIIFALGMFRGEPLIEMVLLAIAVAVSVIPEGLPAAVTAVLAIGMERILEKGGLVRNLLAAETLGSTTTILTDKTGTLTQARMQLTEVIVTSGAVMTAEDLPADHERILMAGILASDAFIEKKKNKKIVRGRPMEKALVEEGISEGVYQDALFTGEPRIDFLPFDSQNRFAASLHTVNDANTRRLYFSGAPEFLLAQATATYENDEVIPLTQEKRRFFEDVIRQKAAEGTRFIAVSWKDTTIQKIAVPQNTNERNALIEDTVFGGLLAFYDPVRKDVPAAIQSAYDAGANVIMLTGDNPETASTIALHAGITKNRVKAVTGPNVKKLSDEELIELLKTQKVFARVLPEQKLRIAKLLHAEGEIVAMTGDGINDAPALQYADIGVAVGNATEVAKEASDLVLIGGSFSIIVSAIKEGRRIIDNLKKILSHLLSTNFGQIFVIIGAMLFALPLPILPVQILWMNIIQEGLLTFAFAFEPAEKDVMQQSPRSSRIKNILTSEVKKVILISGTVTGLLSLAIYLFLSWQGMVSIEEIRTIMFVVLSLDALIFALSLKNLRKPIWRINIFSNQYLIVALLITSVLLVITLITAPLQSLLSLVSLSAVGLGIIAVFFVLDLMIIETVKYNVFKRS